MASKAQERAALEKIRKIVEEVGGEESYIGMAFRGCFEMALDNIENDFGNSMMEQRDSESKGRFEVEREMESAKRILSSRDAEIAEKNQKLKDLSEALEAEKSRCEELRSEIRDAEPASEVADELLAERDKKVEDLELENMKLKARLYDLLCA